MATGLLALLDDVASIADDVATLTIAATKKTTGIVTDDMAVTAEQTMGIARERELPVVFQVAMGSMRNKAFILVPGALVLSALAPWAIRPILMLGGAYLAFEGVEKVLDKIRPHAHADEDHDGDHDDDGTVSDPALFEQMRVQGAIRTDLILSGEIVAITLGEVAEASLLIQASVLYGVSVLLTIGVYGLVAGIVKIDDVGDALVQAGGAAASVGALIVAAAPKLLHAISWIGTIAMWMVGGHILLHGTPPLEHLVHDLLHALPGPAATLAGLAVDIGIGAVAGLVVAGVVATGIPGAVWRKVRGLLPART